MPQHKDNARSALGRGLCFAVSTNCRVRKCPKWAIWCGKRPKWAIWCEKRPKRTYVARQLLEQPQRVSPNPQEDTRVKSACCFSFVAFAPAFAQCNYRTGSNPSVSSAASLFCGTDLVARLVQSCASFLP